LCVVSVRDVAINIVGRASQNDYQSVVEYSKMAGIGVGNNVKTTEE